MNKTRILRILLLATVIVCLCATALAAYATLRYGDSGAAVKKMQVALVKLGYNTGGTDGKFGPTTRTAVQRFQRDNGLKVDGVAGNQTLTLLYKKAGSSQSSSYFKGDYATMKPGDRSSRVKLLQKALNKLKYSCGSVTGIYNSKTTLAVKRFQKDNGITAGGKATPKTLRTIEAKLSGAASTPSSPGQYNGYTIPTRTLRKGCTGEDVKTLQRRLKELGYYTGALDGGYGTGTIAAVEAFQRRNNLTADGVAGTATIKLLFSDAAKPAGDPFPARGDTLLAVAKSQLGYKGSKTPDNLTGANVTAVGNWTKYGEYTDTNGESWCASFVSWCGKQAGNKRIKKTDIATPIHLCTNYNTPGAVAFFNTLNATQKANHPYLALTALRCKRTDVTPRKGDLIFFRWSYAAEHTTFSHVGIVSRVADGKVYYIDGCGAGQVVKERSRSLTDPAIAAYCKLAGRFTLNQ